MNLIAEGHLGDTPVAGVNVRLNVKVQGLGPFFKLKVEVLNASPRALTGTSVVVGFPHELYAMPRSRVSLSALVPGVEKVVWLDLECLDPSLPPKPLRIILLSDQNHRPHVSAVVEMPQSEQLEG